MRRSVEKTPERSQDRQGAAAWKNARGAASTGQTVNACTRRVIIS